MRTRRLKFSNGVSFPLQKSISEIKKDISDAITSGRYLQGKQCKGSVTVRYTNKKGEIKCEELEVHGQKIPLRELRKHILQCHEKEGFMHDHPKALEEYASMDRADLVKGLQQLNEYNDTEDFDTQNFELATRLYSYHHTRLLLLGTDHADLLGSSYLLEVVQVVYDPALYLSDEEFEAKTGRKINVQAAVEKPFIRLRSMSGSSEEQQLRVVPDRAADLRDTTTPLARAIGDPILDVLVGFVGDLQGRWYEAGLQKGGQYRCGAGCGCPTSHLPCYASNVGNAIPSYSELQSRATGGLYGKQIGTNLHYLTADKMRAELRKRGFSKEAVAAMPRDVLNEKLRSLLQGVQRVPALLAFTPTAELTRYGLQRYQIMPCEPLHDIKGHVSNLLTELPHHLTKAAGNQVKNIINATVGEHNRGCDWRKALFLTTTALQDRADCPPSARKLIRLLADVASLLYASADKRTPKMILHLSLCLWRHFELMQQVIGEPKAISLGTLYGGYLHGLLHSPTQLAVVSLSSTNAEALERQQGQTRAIATSTTSRRPREIVSSILIRVQAETERSRPNHSDDHDIEKLAQQLYPLGCTPVRVEELSSESKKENFLALLKTIAPFLRYGEGIWWHKERDVVFFHDGNSKPSFHKQGPRLRHIRSCSPQEWQQICNCGWEYITKNVTLPVSLSELIKHTKSKKQ